MRMALIGANSNWGDMFTRPVAVIFVVVAALFVLVPIIRKGLALGKKAK